MSPHTDYSGSLWLFTIVICLINIGMIYSIFSIFKRIKKLGRIKHLKINQINTGLVGLSGKFIPFKGVTFLSPLTNHPCCWYEYTVEQLIQKEHSSSNEVEYSPIEHERKDNFILLDDGTGQCLIATHGAEIISKNKKTWQAKDISQFNLPVSVQKQAALRLSENLSIPFSEWKPVKNVYRLSETYLACDDDVYIYGEYQQLSSAEVQNLLNKTAVLPEEQQFINDLKTIALPDESLNLVVNLNFSEQSPIVISNLPQRQLISREKFNLFIVIFFLLLLDVVFFFCWKIYG